MSSLSVIAVLDHLTYFTAKNSSNFFFNHGLINQDKSSQFGSYVKRFIMLDISSVYSKNLIVEVLTIIFALNALVLYIMWS